MVSGSGLFQVLDARHQKPYGHPGSLGLTWTPKVRKIIAFMAVLMGLGLSFYILLGFRYRA